MISLLIELLNVMVNPEWPTCDNLRRSKEVRSHGLEGRSSAKSGSII